MRAEAVRLVDEFLDDIKHLKLADGDKVRDLLLDIRIALTMPTRLPGCDVCGTTSGCAPGGHFPS